MRTMRGTDWSHSYWCYSRVCMVALTSGAPVIVICRAWHLLFLCHVQGYGILTLISVGFLSCGSVPVWGSKTFNRRHLCHLHGVSFLFLLSFGTCSFASDMTTFSIPTASASVAVGTSYLPLMHK